MLEPRPQLKLMPALVPQPVLMPLPMLGLMLRLALRLGLLLKPELIIDLPHQLGLRLELADQLMVELLLVQPIEQHLVVRPIKQHPLVKLPQPPMLEQHLVIEVFLGLVLERLNHQQLELPVEHLHHKAFDYSAIALVVPDSNLE